MPGLTKQEIVVIIFLAAMAVLGLSIKAISLTGPNVHLEIVPSELSSQEKNVDQILKQARIVNINKDPADKIAGLPGIGPALAERIIEYRQTQGRYEKPEQLMDVSGIGPKKFEKIKEFVIVE